MRTASADTRTHHAATLAWAHTRADAVADRRTNTSTVTGTDATTNDAGANPRSADAGANV